MEKYREDFIKETKIIKLLYDVNEENSESTYKEILNFYQTHFDNFEHFACNIWFILSTNNFFKVRPRQWNFLLKIYSGFFTNYPQQKNEIIKLLSKIHESVRNNSDSFSYTLYDLLRSHNVITSEDPEENNTKIDEVPLSVYEEKTLSYIIFWDKIEEFQEFYQTNPNQQGYLSPVPPFYAEADQNYLSWIDFAALYGALKIFKFLRLNDHKFSDESISFAAAGGNMEILDIIERTLLDERKIIDIKETLKPIIEYHRYNLNEWFSQKAMQDDYEFSMFYCVCFYNYNSFLFFYDNGKSVNQIQRCIDPRESSIVDSVSRENKFSPMDYACLSGQFPIIKFIIDGNLYDPNITTRSKTALHFAAKSGSLLILKYIVEHSSFDVNARNIYGQTILHFACNDLNMPLLKYLIESAHVNTEIPDRNGDRALHYAAQHGSLEFVKYLIETAHVDKLAVNNENRSALFFAIKSKKLDLVKYLVEQAHLDINTKDKMGETYVHYVCKNGGLDILQYLINFHTFDIEAKNNVGKTPLIIACQFGHFDIVQYLVEKCHASMLTKDQHNRTLLHIACYYGNLDILKYIYSRSSLDINETDQYKWTPLFYASLKGYVEIVKYLIENGARKHVKNDHDETPFDVACNNAVNQKDSQFIKTLLL